MKADIAKQESAIDLSLPKRRILAMATGLDGRHRDKDGEISRKHGNTLVSTLRKIYGPHFAPSFQPHQKLEDILATLDEPSLTKLVHDHEAGRLHSKISSA